MNFIRAETEIHRLRQQDEESAQEVHGFCTSHKMKWKFIPKRTPHFRGLWEASVKNLKFHLRKVLGEVRVNFKELSTVLIQVEACLNFHPLTPFLKHWILSKC